MSGVTLELAKGANTVVVGTKLMVSLRNVRADQVDLAVLSVTAADRVRKDTDVVFFNQPAASDGSVRLMPGCSAVIDLRRISPKIHKIVVAATVDDACPRTFADMGPLVGLDAGDWSVTHAPVGLTVERCLMLVEIYRRDTQWKVRAVSQGWESGLAGLLTTFGVAVEEAAEAESAEAPVAPEPSPPRVPAPRREVGGLHPEVDNMINALASAWETRGRRAALDEMPATVDRADHPKAREYAAARRMEAGQYTDQLVAEAAEFDRTLNRLPLSVPDSPEVIRNVLRLRLASARRSGRWELLESVGSVPHGDLEQLVDRYWPALVDLHRKARRQDEPEALRRWILTVVTAAGLPTSLGRVRSVKVGLTGRRVLLDVRAPERSVVPSKGRARYDSSTDRIEFSSRRVTDLKNAVERLFASCAIGHAYVTRAALRAAGQERLDIAVNVWETSTDPATGRATTQCRCAGLASSHDIGRIDLALVDPVASVKSLLSGSVSVTRAVEEIAGPPTAADLSTMGERIDLHTIDPIRFEQLVCQLVQKMGYRDAKTTRASNDGGVDVIAKSDDPLISGTFVISVKRYRDTVAPTHVRDLESVVRHNGALKGLLITTSSFGRSSYEYVANKPIDLIDGEKLREWLAEYLNIRTT